MSNTKIRYVCAVPLLTWTPDDGDLSPDRILVLCSLKTILLKKIAFVFVLTCVFSFYFRDEDKMPHNKNPFTNINVRSRIPLCASTNKR